MLVCYSMCLVEKQAEVEGDLTRFRHHRCFSRSLQQQIWCVSSDAPYAERNFRELGDRLVLTRVAKAETRSHPECHV